MWLVAEIGRLEVNLIASYTEYFLYEPLLNYFHLILYWMNIYMKLTNKEVTIIIKEKTYFMVI